jgi:hypothetical protein
MPLSLNATCRCGCQVRGARLSEARAAGEHQPWWRATQLKRGPRVRSPGARRAGAEVRAAGDHVGGAFLPTGCDPGVTQVGQGYLGA